MSPSWALTAEVSICVPGHIFQYMLISFSTCIVPENCRVYGLHLACTFKGGLRKVVT